MKRMKGKKKIWIFSLLALLIVAGGGYWLWDHFFRPQDDPIEEEMVYMTHTLYEQDPISIKGKAQLQVDDAYYIKSEEGVVDTVYVEDGQAVEKGATLYTVRLTGQEPVKAVTDLEREQTKLYNRRNRLQAEYERAQAAAAQASTETGEEGQETSSAPAADPYAISQEIAELNEQIVDIDEQVNQARNNLYLVVTAKNPGQVHLNEAGRTDPEKAFVRVISPNTFVSGSVDEYDFFALKDGLAVKLHIPAQERDITGKIAQFDPLPETSPTSSDSNQADQGMDFSGPGQEASGEFTFMVEPDEFVQPGFTVEMLIPLSGMAIPENAVIEEGDKTYVFVLEDGLAKKIELTTERQGKKRVTQQENLPVGTILILDAYDLADGQAVKTDVDQAMDGEFLDPAEAESVEG